MTDEEQLNEVDNTLRRAKTVFYIGLALVVIAPFIFTRQYLWDKLSFSDTGETGDTIGGITAPIVNLIGAVLVYYALKAQIQANTIIQRQLNAQRVKDLADQESKDISQLYSHLKDSIDHFRYSTLDPDKFGEEKCLNGSEAIYKLLQDFYCDYHGTDEEMNCNPKLTELTSILEICDKLLKKLNASSVPDKEVMKVLTVHQFQYRVMPRINIDINNLKKYHCDSCDKEHGLPDRIVKLIQDINSNSK